MGSILTRRRKNGSLGYTAIIRLKRDGKTVVSESATFDRRQLANEWMRRRAVELDQQRARGEPVGKGSTLAELLDWYGKDIKDLTPWGRTKEADLKRLAGYEIAKKNVLRLTTALFALLPATQRWFEAWLGQVVNYAFKVILVILSAALMFKILETFFEYMTTMGTAELLMASIKAIAMAAVVLGVMFSMSSVAAALGGGAAATASGAVGRLASIGAGAGRMLATGHSKRALTTSNNVFGKAIGSTETGASRAANHLVKKGLEMARRKYQPPNTVIAR